MRRSLWIGTAIVLALVALATIALLWEYDSPRIGRAVLDRLSSEQIRVTADTFRLSPLRGVELGGARVESALPGGHLVVNADALVLRHRFWPLLSGRLVADELVIHEPRLELGGGRATTAPSDASPSDTAGTAGAGGAGTAGDPRAEPELRIVRARIDDGDFVLHGAGDEPPTELLGTDIELDELSTVDPDAPLLGLTATGTLRAESYRSSSVSGEDLQGEVELSDGHLRFTALELDAEQGHFRLPSLDFDFSRDPYRYSFEVVSDPLRADRLLGTTAGDFGESALHLTGAGAGEPAGSFSGEGELRLPGGVLPANPTLSAIASFLGDDALIGREYAPLDIRFLIDGNTVELVPFDLVLGETVLDFSGSFDLSGPLDLRTVIRVPRQRLDTEQVPREVRDVLAGEGDRVRLPLAIRGTARSPRVTPASDLLAESSRRALEDRLREELGDEWGSEIARELEQLMGGEEDDPEEDPLPPR